MPDAEMSLAHQEYKISMINASIANIKHNLSLMLDEQH